MLYTLFEVFIFWSSLVFYCCDLLNPVTKQLTQLDCTFQFHASALCQTLIANYQTFLALREKEKICSDRMSAGERACGVTCSF